MTESGRELPGPWYYLEGATFSLLFGLVLFLTGAAPERVWVWVVASWEVLRLRGAAVRGRSTGMVGARAERGFLVGQGR